MTIRQRIEAGEAQIIGKRARLDDAIYELRSNGDWRRVKNQSVASREFSRAVRTEAYNARLRAEVEARAVVTAVPLTKERQKPTLSVTGSPAKLRDFLQWAERQRSQRQAG